MGQFLQVSAGVTVAALLTLLLSKQGKETALLLSIAVCCMALAAVIHYLEPVFQFMGKLESLGQLDHSMVQILLKAVGVSLVAEIASLICADSGNSAMGKAVQMLGIGAVLWLSLPLLQALMELIQNMLGEV